MNFDTAEQYIMAFLEAAQKLCAAVMQAKASGAPHVPSTDAQAIVAAHQTHLAALAAPTLRPADAVPDGT